MEKLPKGTPMTAACEARDLIATIAGPQALGCRIKTALDRVARRVGMNPRRVRALWHGEARRIEADELEALRRAAKLETPARDELAALRETVARLEAYLVSVDPDAAGVIADPYRRAVRQGGDLDRAPHRPMDR